MKSKMLIYIITTFALTACAPGHDAVIADFSSFGTEYLGREQEQTVSGAETAAGAPAGWTGYYTYSGELAEDGYATVDLFIYQEGDGLFGYLNIDGFRYGAKAGKTVCTSSEKRILAELRGTQDRIELYALEQVSEESPEGDLFDNYGNGQRLFSLEREGDQIRPVWDAIHMEQNRTARAPGFTPQDRVTALQLVDDKDRAAFLRANEIAADESPFYQYYDEQGNLQLELFYNRSREQGIGIFHQTSPERRKMCGFEVSGCEPEVWQEDKFAVEKRGEDGSGLEAYEEEQIFNDKGQLTAFRAAGIIAGWGDSYQGNIMEAEFAYRENGTLERKKYQYNHQLFGISRQIETHFYDLQERLVYVRAYAVHGYLEDYYIYLGEQNSPSYRLTLEHRGWDAAAAEFVKYESSISKS